MLLWNGKKGVVGEPNLEEITKNNENVPEDDEIVTANDENVPMQKNQEEKEKV